MLNLDDYGVFIGANGSGKSSALYALDWFFGNRTLMESDVCGYKEGEPLPDDASVEVSVTFVDLTDKDRERLQQYGRGDKAQFRRTWSWNGGSPTTKYVGNAKQGDGFAEVRAEGKITAMRDKYSALREKYSDLPELVRLAPKTDILANLVAWESEPANEAKLIEVADGDATHMFGINGGNVLRDCVRLILVPAAVHIAGQVGEANKGSALSELIGAVMADASTKAQAEWLAKNQTVLQDLASSVKKSVEASTGMQTQRINDRLSLLVPNASVNLTPSVPDWTPKTDPSVATSVTVDGITNDVSRQGHGVQRAVMMSMLQALVPDEDFTKNNHTPQDGEDDEAAAARLEADLASLPTLIVAIEEPELYQHPGRARSFARTLTALSEQARVQIFLATHSPFFIRPEQFHCLHRFTLRNGTTSTAHATVPAVATRTGIAEASLQKTIERTVPTEFSEGFFADKVVLVEGPTDRIVLTSIASCLGYDLDAHGISVLDVGGKAGLHSPYQIVRSLDIPTYVLVDGDFSAASRKHPKGSAEEVTAHGSHKGQTDNVLAWLPTSAVIDGPATAQFGSTTIAEQSTLWKEDIEEELTHWPSLVSEANTLNLDVSARADKNVMLYKQAILAANTQDIPVSLTRVIDAILKLK